MKKKIARSYFEDFEFAALLFWRENSKISKQFLNINFVVFFRFQMSDLKFTPFSSSIHPGFWSAFSKLKLEVLGLEEKAIEVHGQYENKGQSGIPSFLSIEFDAFDLTKASSTNWCTYSSLGTVFNHNTMESFKKFDKVQYLNIEEGAKLIEAIKSEKVYQDPRILSPFVVHMYADLKKYHYYYWFAFPAIVLPNLKQNQIELDLDMHNLSKNYSAWKKEKPYQSGFFWIDKNQILTLEEGMKEDELILAFADPSTLDEHPGWPLRNLLALLALKRPEKLKKGVKILCYRQKAQNGELSIENSKFLQVFLEDSIEEKDLKITGWEKNDKNQFAPRFANMKSSMDPSNLAENSVDLNLKLMKWRLVPELDLNKFYQTKCLLLGSGTLGCNVARCLLGWGVKNITFLDNSKVSYSNPVRQSLFNFEDCLEGGKAKAQAASEMLKKIFPGVKTSGHNINIPMPGHPISDSLVSKVKQDFEKLEELIQNHDVIFLLMDTRESRWLPTVMGMHYDKLVINAALGFDTFLVMRHGIRTQESWEKFEAKDEIPGCQLGENSKSAIVSNFEFSRPFLADKLDKKMAEKFKQFHQFCCNLLFWQQNLCNLNLAAFIFDISTAKCAVKFKLLFFSVV